MPSKIKVLNEQLINQIAAGEVIENSASVIKELVENSIDSGVTQITIEITGGGKQMIRVSDNGCGMHSDDAILCLERHATSKLRQLEDFHTLSSMGFRGEAIPSIASISKMTILTCPSGMELGTLVMVEGGRILSTSSAACAQGTTIEVKNLFFNVPVRKKFQKSPQQDTQECLRMISLQALAHPGISFQLISNQEILLNCSSSTEIPFLDQLKARIKEVLSEQFLEEGVPLDYRVKEFHLLGWLGSPAHHRPNRTGQFLFVNGRPIVSTLASYGIKEGYGTLLPAQRYPLFVIHLSLPSQEVDVNVHPQKREVRFSQEQCLRELFTEGVKQAFHRPILYNEERTPAPFPAFVETPFLDNFPLPTPPQKAPMYHQEMLLTKPKAKVVATLPGYFLVESEKCDELLLIDHRAAHARVLFDQLRTSLESKQELTETQQLLIPYTIELSKSDAYLLKLYLCELQTMGLQIREFGPQSFIIEGLPYFLEGVDLQDYVLKFLENLGHSSSKRQNEDIVQAACKNASVSNRKIPLEEAQKLVDLLMKSPSPDYSPQGKLTMTALPSHKFSTFFKM